MKAVAECPVIHLRRKWEAIYSFASLGQAKSCAPRISDQPWGFAAASDALSFARADTKVEAKAPGPISEKRKKKRWKVTLTPLMVGGMGNATIDFGGSIPVYPSSPWHQPLGTPVPFCVASMAMKWAFWDSLASRVQRKVNNDSAAWDILPVSRAAPHYLKDDQVLLVLNQVKRSHLII